MSVTDKAITSGLTNRKESGRSGLDEIKQRLKLVKQRGTIAKELG